MRRDGRGEEPGNRSLGRWEWRNVRKWEREAEWQASEIDKAVMEVEGFRLLVLRIHDQSKHHDF